MNWIRGMAVLLVLAACNSGQVDEHAGSTVTEVNTAPTAANAAAIVPEGGVLSAVLPVARDAEGDRVTYSLSQSPSHGSVQVNADGGFTYRPTASYSGVDSFEYQVADRSGHSSRYTVSLTVAPATSATPVTLIPVNSAPISASMAITLAEDSVYQGRLPVATDPEGQAVTYQLASVDHGSAEVHPDGSFMFRPESNFYGTGSSFRFWVSDPQGVRNQYVVNANVTPVNDAPERGWMPLASIFGGGTVSFRTPSEELGITSLAVQPDGRFVVLSAKGNWLPVIARFLPDGKPDLGFGGGTGMVDIPDFASRLRYISSLTVTPLGKIVLAGSVMDVPTPPTAWDSLLQRLNADGAPDTGFGGGSGAVTTRLSTHWEEASKLMPMQDGRLLVRTVSDLAGIDGLLLRYNADGSLDTSFGGGDGMVLPGGSYAIQPDGRFVVAGRHSASDPAIGLTRYALDGESADISFGGGDGFVPVTTTAGSVLAPQIQPGGRILLVECIYPADEDSPYTIKLRRHDADGTPDSGFGAGTGVVIMTTDIVAACADVVRLLPDGGMVIPTERTVFTQLPPRHYNADGSVGAPLTGELWTNGGKWGYWGISAWQPNGRVLVVAVNYLSYENAPISSVSRFYADGTRDPNFGESTNPVYEGSGFSRTLPAGAFTDRDGDPLTYSAALIDGSPLPAWLHFAPASLTFSGVPPPGADDLHIRVTVRDPSGLSVTDTFGWQVLPAP